MGIELFKILKGKKVMEQVSSITTFGNEGVYKRWVLASELSYGGMRDARVGSFDVRKNFCVIGKMGSEITLDKNLQYVSKRSKTLVIADLISTHSYKINFYENVKDITFISDDEFIVNSFTVYQIYRRQDGSLNARTTTIKSPPSSNRITFKDVSKNEDGFLILISEKGQTLHKIDEKDEVEFRLFSPKTKRTIIRTKNDELCYVVDHIKAEAYPLSLPKGFHICSAAFYKDFLVLGLQKGNLCDGFLYIASVSNGKFDKVKTIAQEEIQGFPKELKVSKNRIVVWSGGVLTCFDFNYSKKELDDLNRCSII